MGMNTIRSHPWRLRDRAGVRIRAARQAAAAQRAADVRRPARQAVAAQAVAAGRRLPAATYWRRRFVAMTIGLAVLALISWAFSGALGGGAAQPGPGQQDQTGSGAAARGTASPAAGHPASGAAAAPAAAGQHGQAGQPQPCQHGDVVLSLFSSQQSYGRGQLPQFSVDVVTIEPQTCTFNVGAAHVALVIRSGSVRVWNSADCVQGAGNLVSDLQRGVPTVLPISWDRKASGPGCPAESARMPAGSYTATVSDGWLTSNSVTFKIS
jgi:hypothetical protein